MATIAHSSGVAAPAERLPLSVCVGWGMGTLAVAALFNSVNVLLLRYLVDYVGIGAALAGSLIGLSKLYDAIIDPAVGIASDRTRSRIGRRRPFLLAGGAILAVAALLLFNVPGGLGGQGKIGYVVFALLFYATGYALFSVPYMAMPAEMTSDYHERSHLISFRIYAVAAASLIATFVGPLLMARAGGGQAGHTAMSIFVAALVLVATVLCFRMTRAAPFHFDHTPVRIGLMRKITLLFENKPFLLLLVIKLLQLTALAVTQAATPFLFKRVLGLSDTMLGLYFLVFYGSMILSQRVWVKSARRVGKRNIYIVATAVYGLMYLSWYFVAPGEPSWIVFLRALVLGPAAGAVLLFGQSLLPDTMEWDYRRTGLRREGMLSAIYTMVEKLSYALGATITGIVLGKSGYIQGAGAAAANIVQPPSAITAIYILASFMPMALLLASCIALKYYDLSEARLAGPIED
jgi:GPH family glycoside/pentoside/hexuronide:cation symporter